MPQFILNSAGAVDMPPPLAFNDLDAFTQGYIEAMFFTSECPQVTTREFKTKRHQKAMEEGQADGTIPCDVGFSGIAPDTLQTIINDCRAFQERNAGALTEAYARAGYDETRAGRDFWFTRNGHGVGFWDRDELKPDDDEYEALTAEMRDNRDNSEKWGAALAKRKIVESASIGSKLTAACGWRTAFGETDCYFGDDGKVHLS